MHRVGEGIRAGNEEGLRKAVSKRRGVVATLNKKVPHFQTFGLEVFIFTADAAKTKKLGERNRSLNVVRMGRGKEKITMRVGGLVEHKGGEPTTIDRYQYM